MIKILFSPTESGLEDIVISSCMSWKTEQFFFPGNILNSDLSDPSLLSC